ncbi:MULTISPECIES: ATPase [unclassified Brachybacterium]|uniref:ATPase n=1 Tax=unclassified Brachybacterium TaxID=2623841 RepID=UPI003621044B
MSHSELLVIGGASGVGKSSAAFALHDLLTAQDVSHAVVEGDALDLAHPAPWRTGLAFRNLSAIWANYRALGHRRLIYTNTVSVLKAEAIAEAMGDRPRTRAVLLQATPRTVRERLETREHGESLDVHVARSREAAERLDAEAAPAVHRLNTEGRTPHEVAVQISVVLDWAGPAGRGSS